MCLVLTNAHTHTHTRIYIYCIYKHPLPLRFMMQYKGPITRKRRMAELSTIITPSESLLSPGPGKGHM